jgi:hypothetical protein
MSACKSLLISVLLIGSSSAAMAQRALEGVPPPSRRADCDITSQHERLPLSYRAQRYARCMLQSGTGTKRQILERIEQQQRYEDAHKPR